MLNFLSVDDADNKMGENLELIIFTAVKSFYCKRNVFHILQVIDFFSEQSEGITYCGIGLPEPYKTTSNALLLRFATDSIFGLEGFRLQYKISCGSEETCRKLVMPMQYTAILTAVKLPLFSLNISLLFLCFLKTSIVGTR